MIDESKKCFVICPIGSEGSPIRKRSDQILRHVIQPAANECGYETIRADEIDKPGAITNQVINLLVEADLVIADLTDHNPNVMYELAIRHGMRKPVIHIMEKGTELPFDIQQNRTIKIDHHDLDSADSCRTSIASQIRALEADPGSSDNPITISFDLRVLQQSDNRTDRTLAEVLEAIQDMRSELSNVTITVSRMRRDEHLRDAGSARSERLSLVKRIIEGQIRMDLDPRRIQGMLDEIAPNDSTSPDYDQAWYRASRLLSERNRSKDPLARKSSVQATDDSEADEFDDVPF